MNNLRGEACGKQLVKQKHIHCKLSKIVGQSNTRNMITAKLLEDTRVVKKLFLCNFVLYKQGIHSPKGFNH